MSFIVLAYITLCPHLSFPTAEGTLNASPDELKFGDTCFSLDTNIYGRQTFKNICFPESSAPEEDGERRLKAPEAAGGRRSTSEVYSLRHFKVSRQLGNCLLLRSYWPRADGHVCGGGTH